MNSDIEAKLSIISDAMASSDLSNADKALQAIDDLLVLATDVKDTAELLLRKAALLGRLHRFSDARQFLQLGLDQVPDDLEMMLQGDFVKGCLYDEEGKPAEAFRQLSATLVSHSERLHQPDLRFLYEDIQVRRGLDASAAQEFQEATLILKECLSFEMKLEERSAVLCNLGRCFSELEDYESARDYLLQAVKAGLTKEWEGEAHFYLGVSYAHLKLFREAKREFQRCEADNSEYGFPTEKLYGWLSWVCKGLGEISESEHYARFARPS